MIPNRLGYMLAVLGTLLLVPTAGGVSQPFATEGAKAPTLPIETEPKIKTFPLDPAVWKSAWQVQWIPGGAKDGVIAFTDRTGNQVGILDPATGNTQRIPLNVITSPNGITVIDDVRFAVAVAGTGGVAIFDRTPPGKITELQMAGTRHSGIASGPTGDLFVADAQNNDVRIIRSPYSGPTDITKFPLPGVCRGPTGIVPGRSQITVLCGQTNNFVDLDLAGNLLRTVGLPLPNMGAQEPRPSPNGFVFSAFNANQVVSFSEDYPTRFKSFSFSGPAVPTVGYLVDQAYFPKLYQAARLMAAGKKPKRDFFFVAYTPSFRGDGFSLGAFPAGTSRRISIRGNLVGSMAGPGGSIFVADATPGKPAIQRLNFRDDSVR